VSGSTEADIKQDECMSLYDVSSSIETKSSKMIGNTTYFFAAELDVFKSGAYNARNFPVKMKAIKLKSD
jgi:hypothetical protein